MPSGHPKHASGPASKNFVLQDFVGRPCGFLKNESIIFINLTSKKGMKGSDHRPGNTPSTGESLKRMASNTKPINWPYQVVQDFCISAGFLPKFTNFRKTEGLFEDKSVSSIDPETAITIRSLTSPHLKTILKHTPSHVGDLFFQSSRILQIHDNPFNRSTCTFQRARAACTHRATWRDSFYPLPWRIDRTSTNLPTWMVDSYGKCIQVNIFSPMDPISSSSPRGKYRGVHSKPGAQKNNPWPGTSKTKKTQVVPSFLWLLLCGVCMDPIRFFPLAKRWQLLAVFLKKQPKASNQGFANRIFPLHIQTPPEKLCGRKKHAF